MYLNENVVEKCYIVSLHCVVFAVDSEHVSVLDPRVGESYLSRDDFQVVWVELRFLTIMIGGETGQTNRKHTCIANFTTDGVHHCC